MTSADAARQWLHSVARLPHGTARSLAGPAIASNVTVPVVGLVDTALLGHFSDASGLGAVGLGSAVIAAIFWAFAFLRPGTTSLVGRALGAGRHMEAIDHARRAMVMALAMGGAWLALQWLIVPPGVRLLAHGTLASDLAVSYALIRGLSLPAVLVTLVVVGYLIGARDTRTPLVIAGTVAGVNVVAAWCAVGLLGGGAVGAGWATFGAEWCGAVVALGLLRRTIGHDAWRQLWRWRGVGLRSGWRAVLSMNAFLVGRSALLMSAITVVASIGSRMGDDALAANAIGLQMMYLASYALDGYATAAEAMVAREVGARREHQMHRAVAAASLAALAISASLTLAFAVGREPILELLSDIPSVTEQARHTWWAIAALPLVSASAWMLDGVFLGAGRAREMFFSMLAAVAGVFAPVVLLSIAAGAFTNTWLWSAFLALNVARAVTLGWRYARLTRVGAWVAAAPTASASNRSSAS